MSENRALALALVVMTGLLVFLYTVDFAKGQERLGHTHEGALGKFYQSWMMPDNRSVSCCHDQDCAVAETKKINGQWFARKMGDEGSFTPIFGSGT